MKVSIILPAYNESAIMASCLDRLVSDLKDAEIVVVDQSDDSDTERIVSQYPTVRYIRSEGNSRATTMNHGARLAGGDILLFLHVDCQLPENVEALLEAIDFDKTPRGGFDRTHSPSHCATRIADRFGKRLARWFGYMLGDNALVVRKDVFASVGGYWEKPLFEDVYLCEQLRKQHRWFLIDVPVICSSRKFMASGPWKAFWLMLVMQLLYQCGVSVDRLAGWYHRLKNG